MKAAVRCEAVRGIERCPNAVQGYRHINGAPYGLCAVHAKLHGPELHLYLEDPVKLYHEIWRNGKEA